MTSKNRAASCSDVTVIIPAYRAADTIAKCVWSALKQNSNTAAVIVIIDDGCTKTRDSLQSLQNSRLKVVINKQNIGSSASRNIGLKLARTEYVHFLDADDYLMGDVTGPLIRQLHENDAVLGFAPSVQWSPTRGFYGYVIPKYRDHAEIFWLWMGLKQNVTTCSIVWRRKYLTSIGGWKASLRRNQDTELVLRAVLLGAAFTASSEGFGVWCQTGSADRITARTDNLDAAIEVVEGFLAIASQVVPDQIRNLGCAHYLYFTAHKAFAVGADNVGRRALELSRSLGFHGHIGNQLHVFLSGIFGLERKQRLVNLLKRLRPAWLERN